MEKQVFRRRLVGPCVPVVTFYDKELRLDLDRLRAHIRFLIEGGIREGSGFLLVGGAGGDFPLLTLEERKQVAAAAIEEAAGKVPVVVGAQDSNPQVTIGLANYAAQLGADAVQISPPYYFTPSDEDILRLFHTFSREIRTGIMLYNTPWEGKNIGLELLGELIELPNVVAVKWAAPTLHEYRMGLYLYSEKVAMINNMAMAVWAMMLGCTGFITHLANIWPEHEVETYNLIKEGRFPEALERQKRLWLPWYNFRVEMARRTAGESSVVKAALEMVGQPPAGPVRPPARELRPEEKEELREVLVRGGVTTLNG